MAAAGQYVTPVRVSWTEDPGTTATITTTRSRYLEIVPLIPPYPAAIPDHYNCEVMIYRGYWMVSWFKNEFGLREMQQAKEQAKSGKPVSLMELAQAARREQAQASQQEKKPSVLAKLCPPVNEPKKTARSKRAERELL